ncbi:hypothetical protein NAEGRDRAFT_78098, partial [Naegleria gruberi]
MGGIISRSQKASHDDNPMSLSDSYDHGRKGRSASEPKQLSKSSSKKKNSAATSSKKQEETPKDENGPPTSLRLSARRYSQHLDSTIKQLEDELRSNHSLAHDDDQPNQDDETCSMSSMNSRISRRRAKSELVPATSIKQLDIPVGIEKPASITTDGLSIEDAYKQILMSSSLGKSHEEILHRMPAAKMKVASSTRKGPRDDKDSIIKDQMKKAKASKEESKRKSNGMNRSSSRNGLDQSSSMNRSSSRTGLNQADSGESEEKNLKQEINSKLLESESSTSTLVQKNPNNQQQALPAADNNLLVLNPLSNKKKRRKPIAPEEKNDSGVQITVLTPDDKEVSAQSKPHLKWQEQKKRSQVKLQVNKKSDEDFLSVG